MTPLYLLFATASAVLIARVLIGAFESPFPVHSPLNAEGLVAVSFVLALVMRSGRPGESDRARPTQVILWGAALLVTAAFIPGVAAPLVHDSYTHIDWALAENWPQMLHHAFVGFGIHSGPHFRPLGFALYWIDYRWAGNNPIAWHLWNLSIHLINCALVWLLARRLQMSQWPATVTALVFALHGTRPEVVSWAAGRFDLLATCFTLLTLLAADSVASLWIVAGCAASALLTKESAACLPLLVSLLILFKPLESHRRLWRAAGTVTAVCIVFLIYRTWYLGGIGGYETSSGEALVYQFSPIRSAKALLFREWAILFFPINWSFELGLSLKVATVVMIGTAVGFLRFAGAERRSLLVSFAFVVTASLPVQHLVLIGADLSGARLLYLPAVGLALFWGFATKGCRSAAARTILPAGLLVFQLVALEHNLWIWRAVALRSQQVCRETGKELARDYRPIVVKNLPAVQSGVFFLKNGFPTCVEINSGQPASRIFTDNGPMGARTFVWSSKNQKLEEIF